MRPSRRQLAFTVVLATVLVMGAVAPVGATEERHGPVQVGTDALARDSWIVTLKPDIVPARIADHLALDNGGQTGAVYRHALNGFQFKGSAEEAARLARDPRVASVRPDTPVFLTETLPYGIERVAAYGLGGDAGAYQEGFRGAGARIAVVDTGIDLDHPDLVANIDQDLGTNCINPAAPPNDGYGHGTHVAGTAAAPVNDLGVVGIAPEARLVPVKMFDDLGNSSEAMALCAFDHVIGLNTDDDPANDVDVMNMSWGEDRAWGDCEGDALHGAVCQAHDLGIIQVAGAGNSAVDAGSFVPAAYPEVISVSAIADFDGEPGGAAGCGFVPDIFWFECDDTFAIFSNYGPVDVTAPGVGINSTWMGGGWQNSSGTSMATPHITGIMALMAAAAPGIAPADARAALLASGECPNGEAADADATSGCDGQGVWTDDPDGTPEPMGHALRAAQAVAGVPPVHPPSAPTLTGVATEDSVDLSWTAPANDGGAPVTGYEVYRGTSSGSVTLYATLGDVLSYSDTAATPGVTYWYRVAGVNSAGPGTRSNTVSATVPVPPPDPPSAPTLSATAGNGSVTLTWTVPAENGGAPITGYRIYRRSGSGSAAVVANVGNVLTWTNTGLTNGTTYHYQVAAKNSAGAGTPSNEVGAVPAALPGAPRNLAAAPARYYIRLTWSAPASDGGSPVTSWVVRRTGGTGSAMTFTVSGSRFAFVDQTVARRTTYTYTVAAVNAVGQGPPSSAVTFRSR